MLNHGIVWLVLLGLLPVRSSFVSGAEPTSNDLFARKNLVAWCIVPFDSQKRGPEERALMLEKLGFSKFAYDYRPEHIATFDAEIEALKKHHIELTAWWFPTSLNDEAKMTLEVFSKHRVTPQLWVTGGGEPTKNATEQHQRVLDESTRIRPIAEAAARVGCKVALYNHGGWFGEPENQIAIIQEMKLPNVGIVYNQHHGHNHLDRFADLLALMKPHLFALNLNGMMPEGDRKGQKILQLSAGELDLKLLKMIRDSGYTGPIGILGHTPDDAEQRLQDNLDGLDWLLPQLNGQPAGARPKMRTPVPAQVAVEEVGLKTQPQSKTQSLVPPLTEGKFGQALDGRAGGVHVAGRDEFRQLPITVECWTKLVDKDPHNILLAHELKFSGTHWELFTMAGTGNFTVYLPGWLPDHCHSTANLCNGQWHHVSMVLELDRVRMFVDGQIVADQMHQRTDLKPVPGDLALASLVDHSIGCTGLLDEVRISQAVQTKLASSIQPLEVEDSTLALWHLDQLEDGRRFEDATKKNSAWLSQVAPVNASDSGKVSRIEGHWGEEALGFRWTEKDSRDDRLGQMDTGPFFSSSVTGPGGTVYKGIVVRVGAKRTASICYDTELLRASAGWTGFLKFDAARYGIIVPPKIDGEVTFTSPLVAGWSRDDTFADFRASHQYGGLPKEVAHYEGLYRHGPRVVLKYTIGAQPTSDRAISADPPDERNSGPEVWGLTGSAAEIRSRTVVLESPWLEEAEGVTALSRTFLIGASDQPLSLFVAEQPGVESTGSPLLNIRLIAEVGVATLKAGPNASQVLFVPAHAKPVTVKLLLAAPKVDAAAYERLVVASPKPEDLLALTKPGPALWGTPLVTQGEVSPSSAPYVVDTITLPFDNPFRAMMFCGGHDFLPDGRAYLCTLHGDVWLIDGIDQQLKHITWRRFATGLFQPLGVKVLPENLASRRPGSKNTPYVIGRDQITRLHDLDGDGEADYYENFNNDASVSLNGHEYVTCLETDRAGNFYFMKGNCNSAIPHDGSLLRVSSDGSQLDVFATGFRNSNGIGIGPDDQITVAPQEGEWTPASAVFAVRQGGFYGYTPSHHRPTPPTDFERPFCWFPRLADNSSGGQVWVTNEEWGPLSKGLLHLSYGQCKLRLMLFDQSAEPWRPAGSQRPAANRENRTSNGGSIELPLTFASGIHRGRFNDRDGQLYLTGLKGWVSSAVNDGCFQRVRYTKRPIDLPLAMKTYRNGIALTFARSLNRTDAEDVDNFQLEAWNYRWSANYGSPDLRPSAPGQVGRDEIEPKSTTLLADDRTIFIELPELQPVDQLGLSYTLQSADGATFDQMAYLTLNQIPIEEFPADQLHRSNADLERASLRARLSSGIMLAQDYGAGGLSTPMNRRMMAWTKLGFDHVSASGYLRVPATGQYRLSADFVGGALLLTNGQVHELGQQGISLRLRKGFNKVTVRHWATDAASANDFHFRLMWESDRFPREAIPATAWFHETATDADEKSSQRFLAGRSLFAEHQCGRCHLHEPRTVQGDSPDQLFEATRQAPRLSGIGSRLEAGWLAAWLENPEKLRASATMGRLFHNQPETAINDLVAYLDSLHESSDNTQLPTATAPATADKPVERGSELFEQLGCIACHTFDAVDERPAWNRVSLHFVKAKFRTGQLFKFLLGPHQHHPGSQMPDFHLTVAEATQLAKYLEQSSKGEVPQQVTGKGNAVRGQQLFAELNCNRCHQVSADTRLAFPNVRPAINPEDPKGCLAVVRESASRAPQFVWTDSERVALSQYLTASPEAIGKSISTTAGRDESVARMMTLLRCTACHARDESRSTWPEIVADEGSGKILAGVPHLSWVGEKLQGPWIMQLLNGEVKQKPRPWLTARMPAYPAYAEAMAHGFAAEHGVGFSEPLPSELDPVQVDIGRRLTLRDGGLDCRQCHGVGKELPRGDTSTQIALGINFTLARERLRPEFAMRQLLDPPRYDAGSRMPRFAPDLRTTAARHIYGGDATQQFQAIKQYLWSLKSPHP